MNIRYVANQFDVSRRRVQQLAKKYKETKEKNKKSYKQFDATFCKLGIVKPVEENRW